MKPDDATPEFWTALGATSCADVPTTEVTVAHLFLAVAGRCPRLFFPAPASLVPALVHRVYEFYRSFLTLCHS